MLSYDEQYNISNGIFLTFQSNKGIKIVSVRHNTKKRERMKIFYKNKWCEYSRDLFTLLCLYVMYKHYPSSIESALSYMDNYDRDDLLVFKNKFTYCNKYISQDVDYMKSSYQDIGVNEIFEAYLHSKIQFYTLFFFLSYYEDYDQDSLTNIQKAILHRIKPLFLYIKFSELVVKNIKILTEHKQLF